MNKIFFAFLFLLNTIIGNSQIREYYKIDDQVSIQLPTPVEVKDTMGKKAIMAEYNNGIYLILSSPSTEYFTEDTEGKKQLKEYYNGVQAGLTSKWNGNIISEGFIDINGTTCKEFTASNESAGQTIDYFIFLKNSNFYTIQFIHAASENIVSIKPISSLLKIAVASNQPYTSYKKNNRSAYKAGVLVGQILGVVIVIVIGILIIIRMSKKKKS